MVKTQGLKEGHFRSDSAPMRHSAGSFFSNYLFRLILPDVFCPESVASLTNEELRHNVFRAPSNAEKRKLLQVLHKNLSESLHEIRK